MQHRSRTTLNITSPSSSAQPPPVVISVLPVKHRPDRLDSSAAASADSSRYSLHCRYSLRKGSRLAPAGETVQKKTYHYEHEWLTFAWIGHISPKIWLFFSNRSINFKLRTILTRISCDRRYDTLFCYLINTHRPLNPSV